MPDNVIHLPLGKGSIRYMSLTLSHVEYTRSWTLRVHHVHVSQKYMECPMQEYDHLTLTEAIDVMCALAGAVNDPYGDDDPRCFHLDSPPVA